MDLLSALTRSHSVRSWTAFVTPSRSSLVRKNSRPFKRESVEKPLGEGTRDIYIYQHRPLIYGIYGLYNGCIGHWFHHISPTHLILFTSKLFDQAKGAAWHSPYRTNEASCIMFAVSDFKVITWIGCYLGRYAMNVCAILLLLPMALPSPIVLSAISNWLRRRMI